LVPRIRGGFFVKVFRKLGWPVFVIAALLLVSCGGAGAGSSQQGENGGSQGSRGDDASGMQGMDHGEMQGEDGGGMSGMEGMDHGSMGIGSAGMARQMVMVNGQYSDRAFIDAMVPHHQGAIEMAEVALENAEHQQIRDLAQDIVSAQEAEIEELKSIKKEEFGTSRVPMEMSAEEMQMMGMTEPQELANKDPFDKAFIDAMIPHHQSAIEMAQVAHRQSDNPKIKKLAEDIVEAQTREITQMEGWRQQWYPRG
jgi:uncharacterized protein (DUF305 family)